MHSDVQPSKIFPVLRTADYEALGAGFAFMRSSDARIYFGPSAIEKTSFILLLVQMLLLYPVVFMIFTFRWLFLKSPGD
jgi:hypothetical protein